ncbi:serine/threonine-protein kinase [Cellulomonas marina]|uniref:non-specific serine/threonine protein kinase n=1 Tax=Cellulomonas marina TaxID=988821 RepID=A0A1I1AEV1_9CELL|nr:serine/threonine-protein kinase [Cellulomonas marina]GIG30381.1 hypothetical protein Cma02nite_29810 [Cellulomonas marina]SFB35000.1 serine/threonine protein kinase [Cellulomonas marina]
MRTGEGVVLGGRYRLVRPIATGGMGEVWAGEDESLHRPVAVKVLREEFAGDPAFLQRFQAEARNSADLHHENVAQMYDYGEQDGSAYLVQELVEGEPLSDILEREPVLPPARLLPVLAQTARGLDAAHRAGVVHRDVKPGNILVTADGRVKITDFGVSRSDGQQAMTATGMVMGTAQYLSPEQAVGRPATPLSDLYALGVVAYEALAGKRPFTGPTTVDIAVAHVNSPVPPLPPAVPVALAALVLRLLSKEPSARPRSGAELARLLEEAGTALTTSRTPVWPRTGVVGAPPSFAPRSAPGAAGTAAPVQPSSPPSSVPPSVPPPVRPGGPRTAGGTAAGSPPPRASGPRTAVQPTVRRRPRRRGAAGRWVLALVVAGLLVLLGLLLTDRTGGPVGGAAGGAAVGAGAMIGQDAGPGATTPAGHSERTKDLL